MSPVTQNYEADSDNILSKLSDLIDEENFTNDISTSTKQVKEAIENCYQRNRIKFSTFCKIFNKEMSPPPNIVVIFLGIFKSPS